MERELVLVICALTFLAGYATRDLLGQHSKEIRRARLDGELKGLHFACQVLEDAGMIRSSIWQKINNVVKTNTRTLERL